MSPTKIWDCEPKGVRPGAEPMRKQKKVGKAFYFLSIPIMILEHFAN